MDDIRKDMLSLRKAMDSEARIKADKAIFENIMSLETVKKAKRVFTYISTKYEADTVSFINRCFKEGKEVFVPVTLKERMYFSKIETLEGLKKSKMGIPEPESTAEEMPFENDLFIIPGSVFDVYGHRYGYGAGYYDKFLSNCKPVLKIALCYDFQLVEKIATEEHDIDMDMIITDKRIVGGE